MANASIAPALLVAMPQLLDPNFQRAVVLLIDHDEEGSFGLVLNRISDLRAQDLCRSLDVEWTRDTSTLTRWGGPVEPESGWLLFSEPPPAADGVYRLVPGVYFGCSLEALRHVASEPLTDLHLCLGCAGWGPGQLESELTEGIWVLAPASAKAVFGMRPENMWTAVLEGLGVDPATLIPTRGIH